MTQTDLLRFALTNLERLQIPYAIVGSFATAVWGDPRMTRDIDIVVQLTEEKVDALCAAFPPDDFYVSRDAAHEAVSQLSQFNVIHFRSGNKIDFMIAGRGEWAQRQLTRRRRVQFAPDCEGFVAAPEDVIIGKLVYFQDGGSEKHLRDIASQHIEPGRGRRRPALHRRSREHARPTEYLETCCRFCRRGAESTKL